MCGRFAFYAPREAVLRVFGVEFDPPLEARYNIAPTQSVPALRAGASGGPEPVRLRWGLVPRWAKDPAIGNRLINARVETLTSKPSFRQALARRRCVVLASGFYEWRAAGATGGKTPCFFTSTSGEPLAIAGLWERWSPGEGVPELETCTLITGPANPLVAEVHGRMPVLVPPAAVGEWLAGPREELPPARVAAASVELLAGLPAPALRYWEVSRAVNSPAREGPELIAPRPTAAPAPPGPGSPAPRGRRTRG